MPPAGGGSILERIGRQQRVLEEMALTAGELAEIARARTHTAATGMARPLPPQPAD